MEVSEPRRGQRFAFVMDTRLCDACMPCRRRRHARHRGDFLAEDAELARGYGHLTAGQRYRLRRSARSGAWCSRISQRYLIRAGTATRRLAVFDGDPHRRGSDLIPVPKRGLMMSQPLAAGAGLGGAHAGSSRRSIGRLRAIPGRHRGKTEVRPSPCGGNHPPPATPKRDGEFRHDPARVVPRHAWLEGSSQNRCEAGRVLAQQLQHHRGRDDVVVLALPPWWGASVMRWPPRAVGLASSTPVSAKLAPRPA